MSGKVGDFLAWLGGGDKEILAQVPWERTKFTQMAGVLLTTAGLAVVSMSLVLHDGMKAHWFWAVPFGVLWGFVIINLDRLLVLSMGSVREKRRLLFLAAPRLFMAGVLAVVISTPLVLRIFESDINRQIYQTQQEQSKEQKQRAANTAEQDQANQLKKQIDEDKRILAGNLPQDASSPELDAAQSKLESVQTRQKDAVQKRDDALLAWKCERYGQGEKCHDASKTWGQGPLADAKKKLYDEAAAQAAVLTQQLKAAQNEVDRAREKIKGSEAQLLQKAQADARAELPGLQKKYDDLMVKLRNRTDLGTKLIEDDNKLPAQIKALYDFGNQDTTLLVSHLLVGLLFFMIELLPVVVKILLNTGDVSAYEARAKARENAEIDRALITRTAARNDAEQEARDNAKRKRDKRQAAFAVEKNMRKLEVDLGKRANKHVAAEMTTIIDIALRQWSAQLHAQLAGGTQPAGAPAPLPGTPPAAAVPPNHAQGTALPQPIPPSGPPATPTTPAAPAPTPPALTNGAPPAPAPAAPAPPPAPAVSPAPAPAVSPAPAPAASPAPAPVAPAGNSVVPAAPTSASAPAPAGGNAVVPAGATGPLGHANGGSGAGPNNNRAAMGQVVSPINLPDDDNL
ncbi:DUF4407 domain-containing protein [Actinomadura formosensis]|uniref:DUF4407 domain-containing protein n=1 Tax=Actinomadura formosensis TaxID=60706 RepID=UPI003D91C995